MGKTFFSRKTMIISSLCYLIVFGIAEVLMRFEFGLGCICVYLGALFSLILLTILGNDKDQRALFLALGLVPLIRMVSIITPLILDLSQFYLYIIVYFPILVGIILVIRNNKYSLSDIGCKLAHPIIQIIVALLGLLFGAIGCLIFKPQSLVETLDISNVLLPAIVLFIFTGLVDEIAFRGVIQRAAAALGSIGWLVVAVIYVVIQISQNSPDKWIFILVISLFFGYVAKKSGSIIGVGLAHGLMNIVLLLFPLILV